ncbi:MAG: hypothetical protein ACK5KP_09125 [Paludibacteraceae bacterium]
MDTQSIQLFGDKIDLNGKINYLLDLYAFNIFTLTISVLVNYLNLILDRGLSCEEVGDILLLYEDTIRSYRKQFISERLYFLFSNNNKGDTPRLTHEQIAELDKHPSENVYTKSKFFEYKTIFTLRIYCQVLTNCSIG